MPIFEIDVVRMLRSKTAALLAEIDERVKLLEAEPVAPMPVMSVTPTCIMSKESHELFDEAHALGEWAEGRQEVVDENWCEEFDRDESDPARVRIGGETVTWAELKKAHDEDADAYRITSLNVRKAARRIGVAAS